MVPIMKEKSKSGNATKRKLVKAAFKVIGQKGFSNFTIRDIARQAELSTGLVHYHFKNKEDLFIYLFKEMQVNIQDHLFQALEKSGDPLNQLRIFVDQAFMMIQREPNYFNLLINFWSQINVNPRMRELSQKLFNSYRGKIIEILDDGIAYGCFQEVNTLQTAATIVALIQGGIFQYMVDRDAFDYEEFARQQKERITQLVILKETN